MCLDDRKMVRGNILSEVYYGTPQYQLHLCGETLQLAALTFICSPVVLCVQSNWSDQHFIIHCSNNFSFQAISYVVTAQTLPRKIACQLSTLTANIQVSQSPVNKCSLISNQLSYKFIYIHFSYVRDFTLAT